MEWTLFLLGLVLGLIIGAAGAFWWLRSTGTDATVQARREAAELRGALDETSRELSQTKEKLAAAQGRLEEIQRRRAEEQEAAQERESLLEMLHPVRQGVTDMHRRVQELEKERTAQHAKLSEQLNTAAEADAKIIESTQALLGSLHSTSARGHWGEVQLRRVVEAAGMVPHVDFTEQHTGQSPDGETLRPDMVVHLPGGRQLVVDAKAPLNPTDPSAQAAALRSRVEELARKRYWDAVDLSPDVVFCFIPAESLLSAALEHDPSLLDGSLAKGVTLVSPASLLASLKAVEAAWRQERLAAKTSEIIDHSRELYQRLAKMSEHLATTGQRLRGAVEAYNGLIGNIERRVLPKVEEMSRLEAGTSAEDDALTGSDGALSRSAGDSTLIETLVPQHVSAQINPLGTRLQREVEDPDQQSH